MIGLGALDVAARFVFCFEVKNYAGEIIVVDGFLQFRFGKIAAGVIGYLTGLMYCSIKFQISLAPFVSHSDGNLDLFACAVECSAGRFENNGKDFLLYRLRFLRSVSDAVHDLSLFFPMVAGM